MKNDKEKANEAAQAKAYKSYATIDLKKGSKCPHCGQVSLEPETCNGITADWQDCPHIDPFQCVKNLQEEIRLTNERLSLKIDSILDRMRSPWW